LKKGSLSLPEKSSMTENFLFPLLKKIIDDYMNAMEKRFGFTYENMPLIVFVNDEARALLEQPEKKEKDSFHYHRSSCGLFPYSSPFVVVYMDTSARLTNFQPKVDHVIPPSYRGGDRNGINLFEPFYLVNTTDIMARNNNPDEYLDASIACGAEFSDTKLRILQWNLFHLGRPLWGSYLDANTSSLPLPAKLDRVLELAKFKLSNTKSTNYSKITDEKVLFSLFQLRARMYMAPNLEYANEMTADYMATLVDISPDRETLRVDYPSDPVMCEAAADIMNLQGFPTETMFMEVKDLVIKGLVSGGLKGEVMAKYIFLAAFDSTCKRLNKEISIEFTRPLTVHKFLKTLTGSDKIEKELAPQVSKEKLDQLLKGTLMFNHFITVDYTPKMTNMKDFFLRGAAIDCMAHQEAIDLIIPVLLENKTFSAILIQVKNYQKTYDSLYPRFCYSMTPYGCGMDDNGSFDYPYLKFYLQLGSVYKKGKIDCSRKLDSKTKSIEKNQETDASSSASEVTKKAKLECPPEDPSDDKAEMAERCRVSNQVHIVFLSTNQDVYPFLTTEQMRQVKTFLSAEFNDLKSVDENKEKLWNQMLPLMHQ
jgi:hypothetical protein